MLLRMLSACAPCIGYWINPTAYSGQDQDPSNETIVEQLQSLHSQLKHHDKVFGDVQQKGQKV